MRLLVLLLVALVAACAGGDVRKTALALEVGFSDALTLANDYANQPKCGPTAPPAPLCADPAVVAKASDYAEKADAAIKVMDDALLADNATSIAAAVQVATKAVTDLQALIASLKGN